MAVGAAAAKGLTHKIASPWCCVCVCTYVALLTCESTFLGAGNQKSVTQLQSGSRHGRSTPVFIY